MRHGILIGFLALSVGGGYVACRDTGDRLERIAENRTLSERLDAVEREWHRLQAEVDGEEVERELELLRYEIEDALSDVRAMILELTDPETAEATRGEVERALSKLEREVERARRDLDEA